MSIRKTQNSALFVATLGVYLGLLLAGTTPTVLAHAATAKQFDLKDEAGRKDDLDKKPNDCDSAPSRDKILDYDATFLWFNDASIGEYRHLIESILDAYPEKAEAVDISWGSAGEERASRTTKASLAYPYGFLDEEHSKYLDKEVLYLGNGFPGKEFSFSLLRNSFGNEFRFESKRIAYDAPLVRALYSSAFEFTKCSQNYLKEDIILRNTELTVEKDNLVITTRLPRGSLDTLLASDVK